MRNITSTLRLLALLCAIPCFASDSTLKPGDQLDEFPAENRIYRDVRIRSINAHTVIFTHIGGLASARLRDLSPEWQQRFGYVSPPEVLIAPPSATPAAPPSESHRDAEAAPEQETTSSIHASLDDIVATFGRSVTLQPEVNLRADFHALELNATSQGRRPSCAVFAIVSALEFQQAKRNREPEKLSEEYVIWAARHVSLRTPQPPSPEGTWEPADEGFTLPQVLSALRTYGVARRSDWTAKPIRAFEVIEDPPDQVIAAAREHAAIDARIVPGRDNATRITNILHALNAGIPVPIGLPWPNHRTLRTGYVSQQAPAAGPGHAVTLVGYKSPTGQLADTTFLFKNSWGPTWGQGGYGWITYRYLEQHLATAVLVDLADD